MPRYYFHTEDGVRVPDHEGCELPDDHAACVEAVLFMGQTIKDSPDAFLRDGYFRLILADADHQPFVELALSRSAPAANTP